MRAARLERRLTQQSVAEALDVTKQSISHYESGLGTPTIANLVAYCMVVGVPLIDMLEDIDKDYSDTIAGARVYKRDSPQQAIPRYSMRGLRRMFIDGNTDVKPEAYGSPRAAVSKAAFELEVTNLAMAPLLQPGYLVVFDPEVEPNPSDIVLALVGDEIVIRRYRKNGSKTELVAINADWGSDIMGKKDKIFGTMLEFTVPRSTATAT